MKDWQIWSSEVLIEWTHESIFRPERILISALPTDAEQLMLLNGTASITFTSNGTDNTGVAVSDNRRTFQRRTGQPMLDGVTLTKNTTRNIRR